MYAGAILRRPADRWLRPARGAPRPARARTPGGEPEAARRPPRGLRAAAGDYVRLAPTSTTGSTGAGRRGHPTSRRTRCSPRTPARAAGPGAAGAVGGGGRLSPKKSLLRWIFAPSGFPSGGAAGARGAVSPSLPAPPPRGPSAAKGPRRRSRPRTRGGAPRIATLVGMSDPTGRSRISIRSATGGDAARRRVASRERAEEVEAGAGHTRAEACAAGRWARRSVPPGPRPTRARVPAWARSHALRPRTHPARPRPEARHAEWSVRCAPGDCAAAGIAERRPGPGGPPDAGSRARRRWVP